VSELQSHSKPVVLVAFELGDTSLEAFTHALQGCAEVVSLPSAAPEQRLALIREARAIFSRNAGKEFTPGELTHAQNARLLQCFSAGVDFISFDEVPSSVPIACNAGAFAEPMAEHAVAMILAAYKRLFVEQANLARGEFNQFTRNRAVAGSTLGVFGFGGIGVATGKLMTALGARVLAVNRRGATDEPVDFIGTMSDLDVLLEHSDALLLAAPFTRETRGIIGRRELERMAPDATLVNLARGELVDETALYEHLVANPGFTACIDAWWIEPVRHGAFRMDQPFLELPNVIASPHNSASIHRDGAPALRLAGENCRRAVLGETPYHVIDRALSPLLDE
tara:strand:- start:309 stop:1322 length:1014 start_codon:yes stop_codon:yes gene_type:complete